ncbi:MAG: response regulator [Thermomicrobium sp.]|nr:response regulator [Thermomicrobium sp.]MDW7982721.1 response regulator [Thermomicrobium sp.]
MSRGPLIRVLIVDDVQESRDNIERLLSLEPDFRVVGKAARGEEAIELALRLQPHVVLLDQTLPDLDGFDVAAAITARAPGVGVILLALDLDPDMLRRAMLAGAREYLTKPFAYEELVDAIRRVGCRANPTVATVPPALTAMPISEANGHAGGVRGGQIVTVLGAKGGVGRTFLATNLAIALRRSSEGEVVLVDADLMRGDVSVLLNLTPQRSWTDLTRSAGAPDVDLIEDVLTRHASKIRVLLAPSSPEEAEHVTPELVREALARLRDRHAFVIVDTAGGYDEITLACADAADSLIWVLTLEMTAIKDAKLFFGLAERLGYQSKRVILVGNQVNPAHGLSPEDVEESLRLKIPVRVPFDPGSVVRSINEGTPLAWSQPQHRVVGEMMRLAALLTNPAESNHDAGRRRRLLPFPRLGARSAVR